MDNNKKFTEEEREFIRLCDKIKWIARDQDGCLFGYYSKPKKYSDNWICNKRRISYSNVRITMATSLPFFSVKWEDKEPISRKEILK